MKQIIIVLISAIIVFVATLAFTNHYISEKAIKAADAHNTRMLNSFSDQFNDELSRTEQAAVSFLAGEFSSRYGLSSRNVSGKGINTVYYISNENKKNFVNWIRQDLKDFLNGNPYFSRALFFVDDSISLSCQKYGYHQCFALYNNQDDDELHELKGHDFMHSVSYNKVKKTRKSLWTIPSKTSQVRGNVIILYMPVSCEDGQFFGTFVINIDMDVLHDIMDKHLPYGRENSEMVVYDSHKNIIASDPKIYERYGTVTNLLKSIRKNPSVEINLHATNPYSNSIYHGERYLYYTRHIPIPDWYILTICKEGAIYKEVSHLRWIIYSTSAIGMTLMLLCCLVIFRQIRKNMRRKAAAEEELRLAAQVQMSLLKPSTFIPHPSPLTTHPSSLHAFIRPAKEAGGDLYDYVERDGAIIFCIGDVSGKGMPAALFMTQVVSLFRNAVHNPRLSSLPSPSEIVSLMNDVLATDNPKMTFCTFFVGILSADTLTFCNAGHNRPVIIGCNDSANEESPQFLNVRPNLALGLMEGYPYKSEMISFPSGSKLVCYTDGVTEAKNKKHEQYGEGRLLDVLGNNPSDINEAIVASLNHFVGAAEQSDDITIVTITKT